MLRVGLTGGIGSGKSAAAVMLRAMGARMSQSDEVGRELMRPGGPAYLALVNHFGAAVLTADRVLDRGVLARIAFAEGRVEELNGIVHPLVIAAQSAWLRSVAEADAQAVAVVESALIFETRHGETGSTGPAPWSTRFDRIVVVTAPLERRRERYIARTLTGGGSVAGASADFDRRVAEQWTDERKAAVADFVLQNDGTLQALQTKVQTLYATLKQESRDRAAESM